MVSIDIKSVQQLLKTNIPYGHTERLLKKIIVFESYSKKMCFIFIYILEKYFKEKFTTKYFFSVHAHIPCQFGETRMSWGKIVGAK